MRIGIDISQTAYQHTGVSTYLSKLVLELLQKDTQNEYVLFFSSLRGSINPSFSQALNAVINKNAKIKLVQYKIPPTVLSFLWNQLHLISIETFIGDVDIFITSDWTEPPAKSAKKATILYDLIVYKYPEETHNQVRFNTSTMRISPNIVTTLKRKHMWMKKESDAVFCISEATKKDAHDILGIPEERLHTIYPGGIV